MLGENDINYKDIVMKRYDECKQEHPCAEYAADLRRIEDPAAAVNIGDLRCTWAVLHCACSTSRLEYGSTVISFDKKQLFPETYCWL